MAYALSHLTTIEQLKTTAERMKEGLDESIKSLSVSGNTISFFKTEDASGAAAYTVDFPTELFLDQSKTKFEAAFEFTATKYPGAVNPSLDGKPVLVLGVKGTTDPASGTEDDTIAYSFLDMSTLVDTYTPKAGNSAKIITILGYEIEVHISEDEDNAIKVKEDGLHVDISGKTDKVTGAANNIPSVDANGNLADSGIAKDNVLQKANIATNAEVNEMLNEVFGVSGS